MAAARTLFGGLGVPLVEASGLAFGAPLEGKRTARVALRSTDADVSSFVDGGTFSRRRLLETHELADLLLENVAYTSWRLREARGERAHVGWLVGSFSDTHEVGVEAYVSWLHERACHRVYFRVRCADDLTPTRVEHQLSAAFELQSPLTWEEVESEEE